MVQNKLLQDTIITTVNNYHGTISQSSFKCLATPCYINEKQEIASCKDIFASMAVPALLIASLVFPQVMYTFEEDFM